MFRNVAIGFCTVLLIALFFYTGYSMGSAVTPTVVAPAPTSAVLTLPDNVEAVEIGDRNDNRCFTLFKGEDGQPDYIVTPCT